jgi:prepilin peptidase CpaA
MGPWVEIVVTSACMVHMAWIAWHDFRTLRIRNTHVVALSLGAALLLLPGVSDFGFANLLPAVLLFVLGVVFWLFRMMGAGDAKLFFPVGLIVGLAGAALFAIALLPASLLTLAAIWAGARGWLGQGYIGRRLKELRRLGGVPYAVPIFLAALVAVLPRLMP